MMKGAAFPAYWHDSYAQPNAFDMVDYLVASGVNTIQIIPSWFQSNMTSTIITRDPDRSPTDKSMEAIIDYIHQQKVDGESVQVMLKIHLEPKQNRAGDEGGWRGVIKPADSTAWFNSYASFAQHYAEKAQEWGVEYYVVGTEMATMTQGEENQARWKEMVQNVRDVYTGTVTYAAHEYGVVGGHYNNGHFSANFEPLPTDFWQQFDYAATTVYYDIYSPEVVSTTTPSTNLLVRGWYSNDGISNRPREQAFLVSALTRWQAEHGKPVIFAEIGYRSLDHCAYHPFIADPGAPNWGSEINYNDSCQANAYEAAFKVWGGKPWLAGAFWWQFIPKVANARECGQDVDPVVEASYTPCGRLAAKVLSRWYDGHTQPPPLPPAYTPNLPLLLNLGTWDDHTFQRAWRSQSSGKITFTLDADNYLPSFAHSLQMTSTIPCDKPRYGQLDFTFSTPQDFSGYKSVEITARTEITPAGELSFVLIDQGENESGEISLEEWQSTRWISGEKWQTYRLSLSEGDIPANAPHPKRDIPWAHPADFVIPPETWEAPANDFQLDLTNIQAIRIKALTVDTDCEDGTPTLTAWIGDIRLSHEIVTPPMPVELPIIDRFDYTDQRELESYWRVASSTGQTTIGLENGALHIENNLPCHPDRHALVMRVFLRPVDMDKYSQMHIRVAGDQVSEPPYVGEFSVVVWDGHNDRWEEWQSSRFYVRAGGWQTFSFDLEGIGLGDPFQEPRPVGFVIPPWAIKEPQNIFLDKNQITAIGLKAHTTSGDCESYPFSRVLIDDIILE